MLEWVYYVVLTACILQATGHLFTYFRTRRRSVLYLGVPAFLCLALGLSAVVIAASDQAIVAIEDLRVAARLLFLAGSLLWIAEQIFCIARFLVIVR